MWTAVHQGDLNAALLSVDKALRKFDDTQSEWHWRFWALRGEILMLQGRYDESLSFLNDPLPHKLISSDIAVWQKLTQGAATSRLRRFEEAASLLHGAESLSREQHPELLGECSLRLGTLAFYRGDLPTAYSSYKQALQLARQHQDAFLEVAALGSLGVASTRLEHYDESIEWNKQALLLSRSLGDTRSASRIEGNSGWSHRAMGDFEKASTEFEQAEDDAQRAGLLGDRIKWLNSSAEVLIDLGELDVSEKDSRAALDLAHRLKDREAIVTGLHNLASIALAKNDLTKAQHYADESLLRAREAHDHYREMYSLFLQGRVANSRGNAEESTKLFEQVKQDNASGSSLRWEAQADLAQVHAQQGRPALAEREFQESIATISKVRKGIEHEEFRLSFLSNAIQFYDAYVNFLIAQKRPLDALKIAETSRAQTLEHGLASSANGTTNGAANGVKSAEARRLAQNAAFRPQEIARRWKATLLFYWLGEERSYLWAITPTKVSLLPLPRSAEIDAEVKAYRESFTGPLDPLEAGNADGKKLYGMLVEPAEKLIPKNSRVVVLADGSLNSLNFETLIVPGPKSHYWIEDATLLTANSLTLLSGASFAAPPKATSLLLMGDALAASPDFPPLPQAGKEVGLVENYFPGSRRVVLTGAEATASHFLSSKLEEFSYLHFATHGTASRAQPLESAVILSPEGDSYKLYARDIVQHPLRAYLVTISACNGAGMRTYAGEGLVGLAWAFLRAGAHYVIAGLWEVSNASTPQLMDELYKGLRAGQDPATALRNAKLALVHSTGNYRKPFYWAPFQLYAGS